MATTQNKVKVLTEAQVTAMHPREWVAMEVVSLNKRDLAAKGHLIAHSPDKSVMLKKLGEFSREHPDTLTASFFTGPVDAAIWVGLY